MKLKKQFAGEYKGQQVVDGYTIELQVSSLDDRGFTYDYFVNGMLTISDGWYGLRLKDIKRGIESDIESAIQEYKRYY